MDSRYYANILIHMMNDGTVFLLPTVLPLVVIEYGFSYTVAGFIVAIIPLCLGIFQTPIGGLTDRLPNTLLLRGGILIVAAGAFMVGLVPSLFIPGLFVIGFGGSFYHPAGYAYTSKIVKNSSSGAALGLQSSSGDCGTLIAFLTAGSLVILAGWRGVFVTWAALCVASFAISSFFLKEEQYSVTPMQSVGAVSTVMPSTAATTPAITPVPLSEETSAPRRKSALSLLKKKDAILILILFAILGAVQRLLQSYLPSEFFIVGSSLTISDDLTAILTGAGILGGLLVGRLVDRYEGRNVSMFMFASSTLVLVAMFEVAQSQIVFASLLIAAVGFAVAGLYPVYYYMMRVVTSVKIVGVSYGLLLSVGMLSGIVSITVGGYLINISPKLLFIFAAVMTLAGVVLSAKLPKLANRS